MVGEGRGVAIGARCRVGALPSEVGAGLCGLVVAWVRDRWRSVSGRGCAGSPAMGLRNSVRDQPLGLSGVAARATRVPPPGVVGGAGVARGM